MQIIGLTGGIATGKTTAALYLQRHGIPVIDADQLAREALAPGTSAYEQTCRLFPAAMEPVSGILDRQRLGDIVFEDSAARRKLESIVHPVVWRGMLRALIWHWLKGNERVVLDIPLLFEAHLDRWVSYTVVVTAHATQQQERIQARNNLTKEQAHQRIRAQMCMEEKCRHADIVLYNDGDFASLHRQIDRQILQRPRPSFLLHRVLLHALPLTIMGGATILGAVNMISRTIPPSVVA